MASITEATDEIIAAVEAAWSNAGVIVGSSCPLMIEHREGNAEPKPKPRAWGRATVRHTEADVIAMGKAYKNEGTLYLNIFVQPSPTAAGMAEMLSKPVTAALRSHNGRVRFTRVRPQEAGVEDGWRQFNVLASFDYYERNIQ